MSAATSKLMLKSMPCSMSDFGELIQELKLITPRSLNAFGRRRMLIEYADAPEAEAALEQLLGLSDILDKPLRVCSFGPRDNSDAKPKITKADKSTQAATSQHAKELTPQQEINKYVQKLYACSNQCDFMQPPPPYLRYAYPPINADILTVIGDALKNDQRFYTQVLHLMNRMNLAPPFGPRPAGLKLKPQQTQSVATQTEILESESESELESDEDQKKNSKLKRTTVDIIPEQYRKRARQVLQQAAGQAGKIVEFKGKIDPPSSSVATTKIEMKLPTALPTAKDQNKYLSTTCMPLAQLQSLPIYKNYKIGEPSNKLYIKNLDKSVTELHLREIYGKYAPADSLDIKVMQQGRMKGQAFVTFLNHNGPAASSAVVVSKALNETNGILWHEKPMIVCYGKNQ